MSCTLWKSRKNIVEDIVEEIVEEIVEDIVEFRTNPRLERAENKSRPSLRRVKTKWTRDAAKVKSVKPAFTPFMA